MSKRKLAWPPSSTIRGQLSKLSSRKFGMAPRWQLRWFVLSGADSCLFYSTDATDAVPSKRIDLRNSKITFKQASRDGDDPDVITVETNGDLLTISSPHDEVIEVWHDRLLNVVAGNKFPQTSKSASIAQDEENERGPTFDVETKAIPSSASLFAPETIRTAASAAVASLVAHVHQPFEIDSDSDDGFTHSGTHQRSMFNNDRQQSSVFSCFDSNMFLPPAFDSPASFQISPAINSRKDQGNPRAAKQKNLKSGEDDDSAWVFPGMNPLLRSWS